jgi:hypothetical protein
MSTLREGKLQYLLRVLTKLHEVAPNLQFSQFLNVPQMPPVMTLEDSVGVGACEACRGRITKVCIRLSCVGLSVALMLTYGSARPNNHDVKSVAGDIRSAIIAVPI